MEARNGNEVLVSIRCLVYNHERFLRRCLDSFVMQKTNFAFEAIVHDDASTDSSAAIIREYAEKYPHIIKPIYEEENLYSKKDGSLRRVMNAHTRGKYVAMCEGDDFWTDEHKLQRQVDFLESHPDYSICYHKVAVVNEDESCVMKEYPDWLENRPYTFGLSDFEERNIIQTNSVMYRWRFHNESQDQYVWPGIMPGDWMLHMLHAQVGKVYYMPEIMSAYRRNADSIWLGAKMKGQGYFWRCYAYPFLMFFKNARALFPLKFDTRINKNLKAISTVIYENNDVELAQKVSTIFPEEVLILLGEHIALFKSKEAQLKESKARNKELKKAAIQVERDLLRLLKIQKRKYRLLNVLTLGLQRRRFRENLEALRQRVQNLKSKTEL